MTKPLVSSLLLSLPVAATAGMAQNAVSADTGSSSSNSAQPEGMVNKGTTQKSRFGAQPQPFSRLALSGGVRLMGINLQAAMEAIRASGKCISPVRYTNSQANKA